MTKLWRVLTFAGLIATIVGCGTVGIQNTAISSGSNQWLTFNTPDKVVLLKLDADYNSTSAGMNFNGYSSGNMKISVPQGWKVEVAFKNDNAALPHSAMIVPYDERTNMSFSPTGVSFPGAMTPNPAFGVIDNTVQNFTFTADKQGKFAIVCGVNGHASMGMWDTLVVSNSASTPSIVTK